MAAQTTTKNSLSTGETSKVGDKGVKVAVDRFLKSVSFTAQAEVERAIRAALASGKLEGHETFTVGVSLSSEKIGLSVTVYSKIEL